MKIDWRIIICIYKYNPLSRFFISSEKDAGNSPVFLTELKINKIF